MSFIETVERARTLLQRNKRLSLRAIKLEFGLNAEQLEVLVEELVDVQQVAKLEGEVISWIATVTAANDEAQDQADEQDLPPAMAREERRQLTVLFCDLVGSTDLSRRMDEEDYRDLVKTYHSAAATAIADCGGHVAEYLGDGLLAYFGFPSAQEDDAAQAVRSGHAIIDAVQALNPRLEKEGNSPLSVRVGINTGPVVVSAIGSDDRQEMRAVGEAVNVAASLQSEAEPNKIVISSSTLQLIRGRFVTRDLGTRDLKGIVIHIYEVANETEVQDRLDVDPSALSPLVGREQELGLLRNHWQHVKGGYGEAVLISGEGGLGKSRILRTFRDDVSRESHQWLECHCVRHKQDSAYYPLVKAITSGIAFENNDTDEQKLARLFEAAEQAGIDSREAVALIATQLSIQLPKELQTHDYSPEIRRRKTNEALCDWFLAKTQEQTLVMLIEDLHWSDESTVQFLTMLLSRCSSVPVLLLLTFRPEFVIPWGHSKHVAHLKVLRLVQEEAERLVNSLNDSEPLPAEIVSRIVDRADGVPLFLEELTKMVLERRDTVIKEGGAALTVDAIPATLHDSLMARLDRLGRGKQIAQFGAVLGRRFTFDLLKAIAPVPESELAEALQALVDAELIYVKGTAPEASYSFRHALIHDTAYLSLLQKDRREIHSSTARIFIERFPQRIKEEPELVAHHYEEAGEGEKAAIHYRLAAQNAKKRFAYTEADAYLRRALKIVESLAEGPEKDSLELDLQSTIAQGLSFSHGFENLESGQRLGRAFELAEKLQQKKSLFRISMALYFHHQFTGALTKSESYARGAVGIAENDTDADRIQYLLALSGLSQSLYLQGDFVSAAEHIEKMLDEYYLREKGHDTQEQEASVGRPGAIRRHLDLPVEGGAAAALYGVHALCQWALGYPDTALDLCETALDSAKLHGNPDILASSYIYLGWIHRKRRVQSEAMHYSQQACDICDRYGLSMARYAKILRGAVWDDAESYDSRPAEGALVDMIENIEALEATGAKGWLPHCFTGLAEVYFRLQRFDDALQAVSRGLECSRQTGQHYEDSELMYLRGESLYAQGELEAAEKSFHDSLTVANQQKARSLELRAATSLASVWQSLGRDDEAFALLSPIHERFAEGFETEDWRVADALLAELSTPEIKLRK